MIDLTKLHCGVHQATLQEMLELMPEIKSVIDTFPDKHEDFIWDVKVHMLMPDQYPCVPNWHYDFIPRDEDGKQDFTKVQLDKPMYLWLSNEPVTEFRRDSEFTYVPRREWVKFTQADEHRGTISKEHTWRMFIRAAHKDIAPPRKPGHNPLRRHCQVYLDANNFKW